MKAATTLRIPFAELAQTLARVLLKIGFERARAHLCARLFAEATCDGVYTHGLNRFPRFLEMIANGSIDIHAQPELVASCGALERWDGKRGPGNLNAYAAMERAVALAHESGVGCVALANTNHWMRGGTYGLQAADAGVIGIAWTNTMPNLPAWGALDPRLGNNPLVVAVPRAQGHVLLDIAMSQFSFGALAAYRGRGELLPVDGGFDKDGNLTRDPGAIEASNRPLPIGFWKGSGLALTLDLMAAVLSGGKATHQLPPDSLREVGLSQIFIAFDPRVLGGASAAQVVDEAIAFLHDSRSSNETRTRFPGERMLQIRAENLAQGVPIERNVWTEVSALLAS